MKDSKNISDLTPEQSWPEAEKMLDKHFRKKRILLWTLSLLVTGLVIVSTVLTVNHFSSTDGSRKANIVDGKSANKIISEQNNSVSPSVSGSNKTVESTVNTLNKARSKTEEKSHQVNSQKASTSGPGNKKGQKESLTSHEIISPPINVEVKKKERRKTIIPQLELAINSGGVTNSAGVVTKKTSDENTEQDATNVVKDKDEAGIKENSSLPRVILNDVSFMTPIVLAQVPLAMTADYSIPDFHDESKNPPSSSAGIDLSLLVYASPQYVSKNLDSKKFKEYVSRRKNEENGIVTASFGVSLAAQVKKFTVSVGVEYSAWGEKTSYSPYLYHTNAVENGNYQVFYRTVYDTTYIYGNQLFYNPHQVDDSTFSSHVDSVFQRTLDQSVSSVNGINTFHFIEVPVELSFRFTHSRIGVGVTVGLSPAWLIQEKGYYLSKDQDGIESISEIKSVNRFMLNGRVSIDFYYRLNDRISLVARPQFKTNLHSIFKDEYDVNQRYYSTGLLFGLQYLLR